MVLKSTDYVQESVKVRSQYHKGCL